MAKRIEAGLVTLALVALTAGANAAIVKVNGSVGSSGDGLSWQTAYKTLSEAVAAHGTDTTFYIAAGVYHENAITLQSGTTLYGGFAGVDDSETVAERNLTLNRTMFTGVADIQSIKWRHLRPDGTLEKFSMFDAHGALIMPDPYDGRTQWRPDTTSATANCLSYTGTGSITVDGIVFFYYGASAINMNSGISYNDTTTSSGKLRVRRSQFIANGKYWAPSNFAIITENCDVGDCDFIGNNGAVHIRLRAATDSTSFNNCNFICNNNDTRKGSCINAPWDSGKSSGGYTNCLFAGNFSYDATSGETLNGTACINFSGHGTGKHDFSDCRFLNNYGMQRCEGIIKIAYNFKPSFDHCTFIGNCYTNGVLFKNNLSSHAGLFVIPNSTKVSNSIILDNAVIETAVRTNTATFASVALCTKNLQFINCTIASNSLSISPPAAGVTAHAAATVVTTTSGSAGFGNTVFADSANAAAEPELLVGNNTTLVLVNCALKGVTVEYVPFAFGVTAKSVTFWKNVIHNLNTGDLPASSVVEATFAATPMLARRMRADPATGMLAWSISQSDTFRKIGLAPYDSATLGHFVYYNPTTEKFLQLMDGAEKSAAQAGLAVGTSTLLPDIFGNPREYGKVSLGPLNPLDNGTWIAIR